MVFCRGPERALPVRGYPLRGCAPHSLLSCQKRMRRSRWKRKSPGTAKRPRRALCRSTGVERIGAAGVGRSAAPAPSPGGRKTLEPQEDRFARPPQLRTGEPKAPPVRPNVFLFWTGRSPFSLFAKRENGGRSSPETSRPPENLRQALLTPPARGCPLPPGCRTAAPPPPGPGSGPEST